MRPARLATIRLLVGLLAGVVTSSGALLAPPAAHAAEPGSPATEASKAYALEAVASPASLRSGGKGVLRLTIAPVAGAHVDPRAPLKVTLASSAGLALARPVLGREDLADPKAEAPRFEVPFTASAAGAQELKARLDFFVCTDRWCVKQVRDLVVPVDVK
jgi:hypothetical protein